MCVFSVFKIHLCLVQVGQETMFEQLHMKLEEGGEGGTNRFHSLSQGLREEIERLSRTEHQWEPYNVDQLVRSLFCVVEAHTHTHTHVYRHTHACTQYT